MDQQEFNMKEFTRTELDMIKMCVEAFIDIYRKEQDVMYVDLYKKISSLLTYQPE